jgi:hypothetical protein
MHRIDRDAEAAVAQYLHDERVGHLVDLLPPAPEPVGRDS